MRLPALAALVLIVAGCSETDSPPPLYDGSGIPAMLNELDPSQPSAGPINALTCTASIRSAEETYGKPEDTLVSSGRGYQIQTLYWWSQGVTQSFAWGDAVEGCSITTLS